MTFTQADLEEIYVLANMESVEDRQGWHWWSSGSNNIELVIHEDDASVCFHQGACDDDIEEFLGDYSESDYIHFQFDKLDPKVAILEIDESGFDMEGIEERWKTVLMFLACGDVMERKDEADALGRL